MLTHGDLKVIQSWAENPNSCPVTERVVAKKYIDRFNPQSSVQYTVQDKQTLLYSYLTGRYGGNKEHICRKIAGLY
jgi:hypothetical protein